MILFLSNRAIWRNLKHIKPLSRGAQPVLDTREETKLILFFTVLQPICKQGNGPFVFSCCKHIYVLNFVRLGWGAQDRLQNRFFTWRKLWLNLAIAEKQLGLPIPEESIVQMSNNLVRFYSFSLITIFISNET